jgi:anti-anti-sigma regulatory factor
MTNDTPIPATPALFIDLAGVRALTAADLGRLVEIHNTLKPAGVRLALLNVGELPHEILRVTGLTALFVVVPATQSVKRAA